jgi:Flp pilus assembly pilin Flp
MCVACALFSVLQVAAFPRWLRWLRNTQGQDLVEYGLLAGCVSLAIYGGAVQLGGSLNLWYGSFRGEIATMVEESPSETSGLTDGVNGVSAGAAAGEANGHGGSGGSQGNCSASGVEHSDGRCQ